MFSTICAYENQGNYIQKMFKLTLTTASPSANKLILRIEVNYRIHNYFKHKCVWFNTYESMFQCHLMIVCIIWKCKYQKKSSLILI